MHYMRSGRRSCRRTRSRPWSSTDASSPRCGSIPMGRGPRTLDEVLASSRRSRSPPRRAPTSTTTASRSAGSRRRRRGPPSSTSSAARSPTEGHRSGVVRSIELRVATGQDRGFHDLTPACERFAGDASDGGDGLLSVFVPHATAGLVTIELGAGSDDDALATSTACCPRDDRWILRRLHPVTARTTCCHCSRHRASRCPSSAAGWPWTWQSIALLDPNRDNATDGQAVVHGG